MDNNLFFVPLAVAREVLEMEENEVTSVEIHIVNGESAESLIEKLRVQLGEGYKVLDRYSQNETLYKMMKSEKLTIYLILIFILVIIL